MFEQSQRCAPSGVKIDGYEWLVLDFAIVPNPSCFPRVLSIIVGSLSFDAIAKSVLILASVAAP